METRWAWKSAVDLGEEEEGASLAADTRPVGLWGLGWGSRPGTGVRPATSFSRPGTSVHLGISDRPNRFSAPQPVPQHRATPGTADEVDAEEADAEAAPVEACAIAAVFRGGEASVAVTNRAVFDSTLNAAVAGLGAARIPQAQLLVMPPRDSPFCSVAPSLAERLTGWVRSEKDAQENMEVGEAEEEQREKHESKELQSTENECPTNDVERSLPRTGHRGSSEATVVGARESCPASRAVAEDLGLVVSSCSSRCPSKPVSNSVADMADTAAPNGLACTPHQLSRGGLDSCVGSDSLASAAPCVSSVTMRAPHSLCRPSTPGSIAAADANAAEEDMPSPIQHKQAPLRGGTRSLLRRSRSTSTKPPVEDDCAILSSGDAESRHPPLAGTPRSATSAPKEACWNWPLNPAPPGPFEVSYQTRGTEYSAAMLRKDMPGCASLKVASKTFGGGAVSRQLSHSRQSRGVPAPPAMCSAPPEPRLGGPKPPVQSTSRPMRPSSLVVDKGFAGPSPASSSAARLRNGATADWREAETRGLPRRLPSIASVR
eukprot:TRINITY_DN31168_c0_g1_i1.p1 TRINITY_DN31168_c0_g1~~TRINITY_DN31168_c0_g1_i1.p1  ORF type:complete len:545 (-),score=91.47 TRINITY_DN31168_c0_g1_i1:82-1716(-)